MPPFPQSLPPANLGGHQGIPKQVKSIISPACPGSAPGSLPSWTSAKHLTSEAKPSQLASFDAEEQQLYSEPLLNVRAPHPSEKAHSCMLVYVILFFQSTKSCQLTALPFLLTSRFTTTDWYIFHITAEAGPIHLQISGSILPLLMNKTLRYLNSSSFHTQPGIYLGFISYI